MEIAIPFFVTGGNHLATRVHSLPFFHSSFLPKQPWACVITLTSHSGLSFNGPSRLIGCGQPLAQGSCLIRYVLCCTCPHCFCPPPVLNGQQRVSFMCTHPCKSASTQSQFFFLFCFFFLINEWWHRVQTMAAISSLIYKFNKSICNWWNHLLLNI